MTKNFHLSNNLLKTKIPSSILEWIEENHGDFPEMESGEEELFME